MFYLAMGDMTGLSKTESSVSTGVSCDDGEVTVMMSNVAILNSIQQLMI